MAVIPDAFDSTPPRGTEPVWTRVYRPRARQAHLRNSDGMISCDPLERRLPPGDDDDSWRGTGSQEEYERAAALPLHAECFAIREAAQLGIGRDQADPEEREREQP